MWTSVPTDVLGARSTNLPQTIGYAPGAAWIADVGLRHHDQSVVRAPGSSAVAGRSRGSGVRFTAPRSRPGRSCFVTQGGFAAGAGEARTASSAKHTERNREKEPRKAPYPRARKHYGWRRRLLHCDPHDEAPTPGQAPPRARRRSL